MTSAHGKRTIGRYELLREVAPGWLGPLWAVRAGETKPLTSADPAPPTALARLVAVSKASPEFDRVAEAAWASLELEHASVPRALEVVVEDGRIALITSHLEGTTLRQLTRAASAERGPSIEVAVRLVAELATAFVAAEIASRPDPDVVNAIGLTPDSVWVDREGQTRIADVYLAGAAARVPSLARSPERLAYLAPELEPNTAVTPEASVFTLGVMLWELLAHRRLFGGASAEAVSRNVRVQAIPRLDPGPHGVPRELAAVVTQALERDPAKRYSNMEALLDALQGTGVPFAGRRELAAFVSRAEAFVRETAALAAGMASGAPKARGTLSLGAPVGGAKLDAGLLHRPAAAAAASPKEPSPAVEAASGAPRPPQRTLLGIAPPKPGGRAKKGRASLPDDDSRSDAEIDLAELEPIGSSPDVNSGNTEVSPAKAPLSPTKPEASRPAPALGAPVAPTRGSSVPAAAPRATPAPRRATPPPRAAGAAGAGAAGAGAAGAAVAPTRPKAAESPAQPTAVAQPSPNPSRPRLDPSDARPSLRPRPSFEPRALEPEELESLEVPTVPAPPTADAMAVALSPIPGPKPPSGSFPAEDPPTLRGAPQGAAAEWIAAQRIADQRAAEATRVSVRAPEAALAARPEASAPAAHSARPAHAHPSGAPFSSPLRTPALSLPSLAAAPPPSVPAVSAAPALPLTDARGVQGVPLIHDPRMSAPSFTQLDAPVRTPSRAVVVAIAATALVLAAGVTWLLVGHRAEPVPAAPSTSSLQSRP